MQAAHAVPLWIRWAALACLALTGGCEGESEPDQAGAADTSPDGTIGDAAATDAVASDATDDTTPPDGSNPDVAGADSGGPAAWQVCAQPADCVAVEISCCDHCNGGEAWPVHKDHAAEAAKWWKPSICDQVACTEKACAPAQTTCFEGRCVLLGADGCKNVEAARLCVRGTPTADGESIAEGDPVQIQVFPKGCWSSSCTQVVESSCQIMPGDFTTFVQADFCLKDAAGTGRACTGDCNGGGFASCSDGQWWNGTWPVAMNGMSVEVTVPSMLPAGGKCVGEPW